MGSYDIGAQLREKRLALGLSVDDVVAKTRIQAHFLEAIESNDLKSFPSITFTRNFVRLYAEAIDVDPNPFLAQLPKVDQSTVPLPEAPSRPRVKRTKLYDQPSWTSAALALTAAILVSGVYLYHNQGWRISIERRAPADHDTVKADTLPTPPPAPKPVVQAKAISAPAAPAVEARVASKNEPKTVVEGPLKLVVTAHERTWVSVKVDGKTNYAYIGTLTPNESQEVSAWEQIKIMTGNAGGITVSLNGKTLDPIGNHGQFRHIRLTAEGSELLTKDGSPLVAAASAASPL